jgi:nucleotidyltransferase/DNA polymerase involved in DNA repair
VCTILSCWRYVQRDAILKQIEVGDVWGIGRQWSKKLKVRGIYTAYDLAMTNAHLIKKQYFTTSICLNHHVE